jgi:SAM-dependent methyltransferase
MAKDTGMADRSLPPLAKYVGRHWTQAQERGFGKPWWSSPALKAHIDRQICRRHETGVPGLLRELGAGQTLAHGVSIGAGSGQKELRLLQSGLVNHFTLYELSEARAEAARASAVANGVSDQVTIHVADAFAVPAEPRYDLVYWDHALHHMMDVDFAISWSVKSLRTGGVLLVNDYVGPTRLQWTSVQIDRARAFLAAHADALRIDPRNIRYKSYLSRFRQMVRDPSEAPQSDRIEAVFHKHCGREMIRIGGAMIHLCASYVLEVTGSDNDHPILRDLIRYDLDALGDGHWHFAAAGWVKP